MVPWPPTSYSTERYLYIVVCMYVLLKGLWTKEIKSFYQLHLHDNHHNILYLRSIPGCIFKTSITITDSMQTNLTLKSFNRIHSCKWQRRKRWGSLLINCIRPLWKIRCFVWWLEIYEYMSTYWGRFWYMLVYRVILDWRYNQVIKFKERKEIKRDCIKCCKRWALSLYSL